MKSKIINISTKAPTFDCWLQEVLENSDFSKVNKALLFWEDDEEGNWARLNCDTEALENFAEQLNKVIFERKLEDFMERRINDFLKYVENE